MVLFAEDLKLLSQDQKDSREVLRLQQHQAMDAAKIELILGRYVVTHNCPTRRAGISPIGIQCETPPPMQPIPAPPPGTAN